MKDCNVDCNVDQSPIPGPEADVDRGIHADLSCYDIDILSLNERASTRTEER